MKLYFSIFYKRSSAGTFKAFILMALCQSAAYSQNFNVPVTKATGDLNKDGIEDLVTVTQDTIGEAWPYRIEVSFGTENGSFRPVVSSDKLIPESKYGYMYGSGFRNVEIKKGVLYVNMDLLRGGCIYKFRYQNGNFELIGYTHGSIDSMMMIYSVDFNLSTGMKFSKQESNETGKVVKDEKIKKLIRPLPKFQDVIIFENDWE
jgi:hypothetical protein